jgi:uncharacterized Zn finger protein
MGWYEWRPYISVAERRRKAEQKLKGLQKKGQSVAPVTIEGGIIAKSFWGKSWCSNLERYSDFANRLPRGRTYVRNGSVVDLQITKGEVLALVSGSKLYKVKIGIAPVAARRWKSICRDCSGAIDSLVELLQGRLAKAVMNRVCREGDGLFPTPAEIELSCSCPDWADLCKHVAAALYGVGARLDEQPQMLFVLRGVDQNDLLASAGQNLSLAKTTPASAQVLDDGDVAALFGLEFAETTNSAVRIAARQPRAIATLSGNRTRAAKKTAASRNKTPPATRAKPDADQAAATGPTKRRARRPRSRSM